MPLDKDFSDASDLLIDCRLFINNIVPGCAAGHDELNSLKKRIDLYLADSVDRKDGGEVITNAKIIGRACLAINKLNNNEGE
jgi:hypothetical protein